jgi:hypothetical protein
VNPRQHSRQRRTRYVVVGVVGIGLSLGGGVLAIAASNGDRIASVPDHRSGGIVTTRDPDRALRLHPRIGRKTIEAGETATFSVGIYRRHALLWRTRGSRRLVRARVGLHVFARRAPGVTTVVKARSTRSTRSTLTVKTTSRTRPGTYRFAVRGHGRTGTGRRHRTHRAQAWVTLVVVPPRKQIAIHGEVTALLAPGVAAPIDLYLTNPNRSAVKVIDLDVRVARVDPPAASASRPCTGADFAVHQFTGDYGFSLPPSDTRNLSSMGIPSTRWPRLAMTNRAVNQDGCKGARVTLSFAGAVVGDHS